MKLVVEDCLPLDCNQLAKSGAFGDASKKLVRWASGASADIQYVAPHLAVRFFIAGQRRAQSILITTQACTAGGSRYYFQCPGCDGRRYRLRLGSNALFLCPGCHNLPYYLQQAGDDDKLFHTYRKTENTLLTRNMKGRRRNALIALWLELDDQIERRGIQRFGAGWNSI